MLGNSKLSENNTKYVSKDLDDQSRGNTIPFENMSAIANNPIDQLRDESFVKQQAEDGQILSEEEKHSKAQKERIASSRMAFERVCLKL